MHIPTHIMSGWCVGNLFNLTPRERLMCMAAASLEDLDGFGAVLGTNSDVYQRFHHNLCHNLTFVTLVAIVFAIVSRHRIKALLIYFFLGHLHLLMDYFGSGPGWGIRYFWPFDRYAYVNPHAWEFFSWQNITTTGVFLIWTIVIAARKGRTPLELITPDLDRRLVSWVREKSGYGIKATNQLR
jgi:inner membrane protein